MVGVKPVQQTIKKLVGKVIATGESIGVIVCVNSRYTVCMSYFWNAKEP